MVVEIACTCDGLPAHSHVWRSGTDDAGVPNGERLMDEYDVHIWVDWKEIAKELMTNV